MINYDGKIFRPISNSENGEVDLVMQFEYKQQENIVSSTYSGGRIKQGQLIALVDEQGHLDMRYHQINWEGKILTGVCCSTPEIMPNGKIRLHEKWKWTCGDHSEGESILEEL